jgi:hypothetical protein
MEDDDLRALLKDALYWLESIGDKPAAPGSVLGKLIDRIKAAVGDAS